MIHDNEFDKRNLRLDSPNFAYSDVKTKSAQSYVQTNEADYNDIGEDQLFNLTENFKYENIEDPNNY